MRRFRGGCICVGFSLVSLLLAGCGDDGGSSSDGAAGPSTTGGAAPTTTELARCSATKPGSRVSFGVSSFIGGLDPTQVSASGVTGSTELAALYDVLMRWNPDTNAYEPQLAESLTSNADKSEWTLKLRAGVKFGNGDPFTAEAVKASIERFKEPATTATSKSIINQVIGVITAPSPLEVHFKLLAPWAGFPYILAGPPGMIVNPNVVKALGREQLNKAPTGAGAGAYTVTNFAPAEELALKAKSDYWGGPVCVENVRFVDLKGSQATYDAIKTGTLDIGVVQDAKVIDQARTDKTPMFTSLVHANWLLRFNLESGPAKDLRVRQAINAAIDRNVVNQRAVDGKGLMSPSLINERSSLHPDVEAKGYDPELAKKLVAEAKAAGWDGKIKLTCWNTPDYADLVIALETMFSIAGMQVTKDVTGTITSTVTQVLTQKNFEVACWGHPLTDAAPWGVLNRFASTSTGAPPGYKSPQMDTALTAVQLASTPDEMKKALGQVQTAWNETLPSVVIAALEWSVIHRSNVQGIRPTMEAAMLLDRMQLT